MIFGVLNPEKNDIKSLYIWPPLPIYCSHFTLGNWKKKSFFQQYYSYISKDYLRYLRRNKLQLMYCSLGLSVYLLLLTASYYLRSPVLWSVFSIYLVSHFVYLAAKPQPALFSATDIWRNATLPSVRCKSFAFYKVVRWHFFRCGG